MFLTNARTIDHRVRRTCDDYEKKKKQIRKRVVIFSNRRRQRRQPARLFILYKSLTVEHNNKITTGESRAAFS